MTEQIEDEFWAQERARAAAERGRHADPAACGTCRNLVAAGGQVQHDECAQRAVLLPAPDAPGYELVTGMSEEEVWALPARFHIPAFVEPVKAWVCAVCWGDGWSTMWPCKTAVDQGLRVFTADDYAETRAKREAAELAAFRALELGSPDGRVSASCDNPEHPTWLRAADDERGCPWCAIAELEAQRERRRIRLVALDNDALNMRGSLSPMGEERKVPFPLGKTLTPAVDWLIGRVAELETELAKYVGAEPTIADEMAYLSRCLDTVLALCDKAEQQAGRREQPLPVPEWVTTVRKAAEGLHEQTATRPALPWAHVMDDYDLSLFLDDLVSAALNRWQTDQSGPIPDRVTLAEIEKACARWRTPGQGPRSDEPAKGESR